MTKRRKIYRYRQNTLRSVSRRPAEKSVEYLLEQGTIQDLREAKEKTAALLKYNWEYYSELAHQRNQIKDQLKKALNEACISNFRFEKWQRAVKYKYGLHPLSTVGSVMNIGQRFNMGDINQSCPRFSALYIACDKDTALQETLGQIHRTADDGLNPLQIAFRPLILPGQSIRRDCDRGKDKKDGCRSEKLLKGAA